MKTQLLLVLPLLALAACADTSKMNRLSVGMNKAEVLSALDRDPDSTSAQGGAEYLLFNLWRDFWDRRPGNYSDRFFVRLINGKVESYGRVGDFNSTNVPETRQTIDLNVRKSSK